MKPHTILFVAAFTAGVLALALAGCGGQVDGATPDGQRGVQTITAPQLRVLDGTPVDVSASSLSGSGSAADTLAQLHAGDVVVSSQAGGFLREVVSVTADGDRVVVGTGPAALDQALVQGQLHASHDLLAAGDSTIGGDRSASSVVNVPPVVLNFDELPIFDYGAKGKLALNGQVTLHPYLDFDLAFSGGKVKNFDLIFHGDIDANVALKLTAGGDLSQSFAQTIWQMPPVVLTQFIGPVPLVETISVELVAVGEAHAGLNGTLTLGGLEANAQLSAGAKFDGSQWSPVGSQSIDVKPIKPSLAVNAHAGASVKLQARVSVRFYDVAGPFLGVGPYAKVDVVSDNFVTPVANGRVGVNGDFGGDVSILGRKIIGFDVPLFDVGKDFSFTF
jgi:hypothetical protein